MAYKSQIPPDTELTNNCRVIKLAKLSAFAHRCTYLLEFYCCGRVLALGREQIESRETRGVTLCRKCAAQKKRENKTKGTTKAKIASPPIRRKRKPEPKPNYGVTPPNWMPPGKLRDLNKER